MWFQSVLHKLDLMSFVTTKDNKRALQFQSGLAKNRILAGGLSRVSVTVESQGNHTRHAGDTREEVSEMRGESVSFLNDTGNYRTKKQTNKKETRQDKPQRCEKCLAVKSTTAS